MLIFALAARGGVIGHLLGTSGTRSEKKNEKHILRTHTVSY
jgi:hypothetical protein